MPDLGSNRWSRIQQELKPWPTHLSWAAWRLSLSCWIWVESWQRPGTPGLFDDKWRYLIYKWFALFQHVISFPCAKHVRRIHMPPVLPYPCLASLEPTSVRLPDSSRDAGRVYPIAVWWKETLGPDSKGVNLHKKKNLSQSIPDGLTLQLSNHHPFQIKILFIWPSSSTIKFLFTFLSPRDHEESQDEAKPPWSHGTINQGSAAALVAPAVRSFLSWLDQWINFVLAMDPTSMSQSCLSFSWRQIQG